MTEVATAEANEVTGSLTQAEILLRKSSAKPAQSDPALDSDEMSMAKAFVRASHEILGMRARVLSASARTEAGIEQLAPVFEDHALCLAGTANGATGGPVRSAGDEGQRQQAQQLLDTLPS